MSKETYNDQTITQYLLGSLPDAEAERLDELSFTDDEFAEALWAAEKDLVDAYVQGELMGAALKQFKSHYLASPLRREKVEFARAFQYLAGNEAAALATEGWAGKRRGSVGRQKGSVRFKVFRVLASRSPALRWGVAFAVLLLVVSGGWLAFESARRQRQASQTQAHRNEPVGREPRREIADERPAGTPAESELRAREERERREQEAKQQREVAQQAAKQRRGAPRQQQRRGVIASFVLTPQMRAAGQVPTVSIPAETDYISMRLELEPSDYPAYRVALLNPANNQTLWRSNKLRAKVAGDGKALGVIFPARLLQSQTYLLRVFGVPPNGASEIISDYPFRVVK